MVGLTIGANSAIMVVVITRIIISSMVIHIGDREFMIAWNIYIIEKMVGKVKINSRLILRPKLPDNLL